MNLRLPDDSVSTAIGGATLSFDISDQHPYRNRVLGLLAEVRQQVNALWNEVESYNARNPLAKSDRRRFFFYFGQYLQDDAEDVTEDGTDTGRELVVLCAIAFRSMRSPDVRTTPVSRWAKARSKTAIRRPRIYCLRVNPMQ